MAQYGKLSGTITDDQGNPISGAFVEVRRQGAFVTSTQAGPAYTVNDPGGVEVGDQVRVNTLSGPSRNVNAVTATTITTSGPGLGTLNNNDRITVFSALPTLYADAQGAETKANPLQTDASGFWYCWAQIRPYDIIETYGTTIRLKTDVVPEGQEYVQSNVFTGGPAIAFRHGTTRTLTSGKLLVLENPIGVTEMFGVEWNGDVTAAGDLAAANGVFTGNMTVTGDLTVDDIICDDLTVQDIINSGSFTYSGAAGSWSMTAGSIETADLAVQATMITRVADGTTDFVVGAAYAAITSVSITATPASTSSEFVVQAVIPITTDAAAATVGVQMKRDGTVVHEGLMEQATAASRPVTITVFERVTGLSTTPHTWTVEAKASAASKVLSSSTNQKGRLIVMEFKR